MTQRRPILLLAAPRAIPWAVPLLLSACGQRLPAPPKQAADTMPGRGVIVAVRPVTFPQAAAPDPQRPDPRRNVLALLSAAPPATGRMADEFIVREDGGRILSIVQPPMPGLQPGRPVTVQRGARTRILPAL